MEEGSTTDLLVRLRCSLVQAPLLKSSYVTACSINDIPADFVLSAKSRCPGLRIGGSGVENRKKAQMLKSSPPDEPSARIGVPRTLRFLMRLYPTWALPVVLALGLVSYGLEGIRISLFIPLLQTLN